MKRRRRHHARTHRRFPCRPHRAEGPQGGGHKWGRHIFDLFSVTRLRTHVFLKIGNDADRIRDLGIKFILSAKMIRMGCCFLFCLRGSSTFQFSSIRYTFFHKFQSASDHQCLTSGEPFGSHCGYQKSKEFRSLVSESLVLSMRSLPNLRFFTKRTACRRHPWF